MQDDVRSQVLSTIPYGFYLVGTLDTEGTANGLTVNWALQTSFEPPQIAVVIERGGNAHHSIRGSEVFSLNCLDRSQEDLARRPAQHVEPEGTTLAGARFSPGPQTGAPIFDDCFAHLECRVVGSTETGDHTLFIGEVVGAGKGLGAGVTEATVFGPFFVEGAPLYENGDDLANGAPGEPCFVEGGVSSTKGAPIPNAHLEVGQADDEGLYDVQREGLSGTQGRGHLYADEEGKFHFRTVRPEPYPIPDDGTVGDMLKAADRSPMRPAHIYFMVSAPDTRP